MGQAPSQPAKKSILKRWWFWVIIILFLFLVLNFAKGYIENRLNNVGEKVSNTSSGRNSEVKTREGATINNGPSPQAKAFTDEQYKAAEIALAAGAVVEDPQNDWVKYVEGSKDMDGRDLNPNTYPLGWTDLRSVTLGADQTYLYIKHRFWGILPKTLPTQGEDQITGTTGKIDSFRFTRSNGQKDSADLSDSIWWMLKAGNDENNWSPLDSPMLDHAARITPTGADSVGEMGHKTETSAGLIGGGPGTEYLLAAYPLSLFDIKIGSEVTFDGMSETGSKLFHHEAVDFLQQEEGVKFGITIKWTLGTNKYETIKGFDRTMHE